MASSKKKKRKKAVQNVSKKEQMKMVAFNTNGSFMYNGKVYENDLVRSCIRPFANAAAKIKLVHVRDSTDGFEVFPDPVIRNLLQDPNPLMGMPALLQKNANQYKINSNAYILVVRDADGYPMELYPIDCFNVSAEVKDSGVIMTFNLTSGKTLTADYRDIIHPRADFTAESLIFGSNPKQPLTELLDLMNDVDKSVSNAIKNSGIIRWLIKYSTSMRPEDLKANVKEFVDNYLSIESETFGAAGVDAKADAQRIDPKDYVPNQTIQAALVKRVYNFFNTNEKIINSTFTEDEWNSYYEAEIEGYLIQLADEFTRKLFTRRERAFGNRIVCESANLDFASMKTKLGLTAYADRGIMSPNEIRGILHLAPTEGGDEMLLRKDTGRYNAGGGGESE